MTSFRRHFACLSLWTALVPAALLHAQCLEWSGGFEVSDLDAQSYSSVVYDDGSGPAVYFGGQFQTAGPVVAKGIARWDGAQWSALPSLLEGAFPNVRALAVHDDGSGAALYASGNFSSAGGVPASRIARWDGASWSPLSSGFDGQGNASALAVYDDGLGGGPALYATGNFLSAGGVSVNRIARWDGSSWSALGNGLDNGVGLALAVYDDGAGGGPALYVGGTFTSIGGAIVNGLARWDGVSWSTVGGVTGGVTGGAGVRALGVHDDGLEGGPVLVVGGSFTTVGGSLAANNIARWNGTNWAALAGGIDGAPFTLRTCDLGSGPQLYVGGSFDGASGVASYGIVRWDGTSWSGLASGVGGSVNALSVFDAGSGPKLYVSGFFVGLGNPSDYVAIWDGSGWSGLGSGGYGINGTSAGVSNLWVHDDGSGGGPSLYAAGLYTKAGGVASKSIARWNGAGWSPLGSGLPGSVYALATFDDGSGPPPALYAGGAFTLAAGAPANCIARWDGNAWSAFGGGTSDTVTALCVWDDGSGAGSALYAGGAFATAGVVAANSIARWDGNAWSALGGGFSGSSLPWGTPLVAALVVHDDGSGPALYAGGYFTHASGTQVNGIARWDGTAWSAVGGGLTGGVYSGAYSLLVFDDGSGPALYAGGEFNSAGGLNANGIARWSGGAWSALGSGVALPAASFFLGTVSAMRVFDDGSGGGPALYAGGTFDSAGGASAHNLARWDGANWSGVGGAVEGTNRSVTALAEFDDGSGGGSDLYVGGYFTVAGGKASVNIARWTGCQPQALSGTPHTLYLSSGGAQSLALDAGVANAGKLYLLLGSLTGTSPGIGASGFVVPLNYDAYMQYTLAAPNHPPLSQSLGLLDAQGKASAGFALAPGFSASLGGINAYHAYVAIDPSQLAVVFASNPVSLTLQP